jgi:hypothetical protein
MSGKRYEEEQLADYWRAFKDAGWNLTQLSEITATPYPTWQHRIRACKAAGYKEKGERVEKDRKIPTDLLEHTYRVYKEAGGNQTKAAEALGLTRSAFQGRLSKIKTRLGLEYTEEDTKILLLDIETAPNRAFVWGTWKQNINPDWIDANGYVLCWTAKWLGEKEATFHRLKAGKHKALLWPIHQMLSEAHAVVHYNGTSFDIPTLNKEFLTHGFTPPSPYKQVDLLLTMREGFRFPNNKLDYIVKTLSLGEKLRHDGPQLWLDCMKDDADAWKRMEEYNRRDVEILEKLYVKLLPWIKKHPNRSAISGHQVCPSCGSDNYKRDGTYTANQLKYPQYKCGNCSVFFRGTKTISERRGERFSLTA